ncbi:betaine/proline/choline family ABC transporter ATP-binding protein [Paenibacillus riograndensis]|uniref:Quaternary amine transport ATP-binding protein n=1 Tax=Paenibacillus riograndensis SBR5 TaxID=1073571 RepID=A0A0E3WHN6_9BACL|nr:betaine/proline/choline family ABC transporter ATP-binding protein [Paenibacillus riograndensis]CQR55603.1 Glycine betaine/carnitine/choline transport ATP-binding protein OpuCA [Paenibacillus riograndensis SBR5]
MTEAVAVEFRNVSKDYGSGSVLRNFNLTVPKGQIVTIIGPSGCGKTTLLKMINRLVEPSIGNVLVEGTDIGTLDAVELRRDIGYVIQQIGLFPHMTIEENISIVPKLKGAGKTERKERVDALLSLIGLPPEQYRKRYPHELSGGQQQRIGVARALASDPSIILMDEPFSALDPISRVQLQKELINLNQRLHKTIVFVTHDIDEALKIADRIILLNEGEVVQNSTPEELLAHPANDFVIEFVGQERFQPALPQGSAHHIMIDGLSIGSESPISEALEVMRINRVEGLAVIGKWGDLLGIVGIGEIGQHLPLDSRLKVGDLLQTDTVALQEHTPLSEVFELMRRSPILPVVDDDNRLIGTVTRSCVIEALGRHLHREVSSA